MTASRLAGVLGAVLLSACNSQVEVLAPLPRVDGSGPALDAGFDAAAPRAEASLLLDSALPTSPPGDDGGAPKGPERVVSAFGQTCAVLDRALFCWGLDLNGQVGVPGDQAQLSPVRIDPAEFIDVCAGEFHSCALRADGAASCWGENDHGQLGVADFQARELPTELGSPLRWSSIACGGRNTCALTPRGELYCWGENAEGRLGQGDPGAGMPGTLGDSATPVAVRADLRFTQVMLGQGHVCAIAERGALYCWGRNTEGQLGLRNVTEQQRAPALVESGSSFAYVTAGQRHSCAIDTAGKLYCWGMNTADLLAVDSEAPFVRAPMQVGSDSDYASVSASWFHTCALKKSGTLVCWGRNEEGQLGLGDMTPRSMPTRTGPELAWRSVAAGQFHTCAFGKDGLSCWGANDSGQLGLNDTARRYVPFPVQFP